LIRAARTKPNHSRENFQKIYPLDFSLVLWDRLPSEEALTGHTNGTGFEEGSKREQLFNGREKFYTTTSLGGAVSAVV
tara:strand:- start:245 stop:478 length:234 start_codon:yes stop_codon:yes gene_type:complete